MHFDLLQGAKRPPRVHQADSRCAEEAVGTAQGGGAEPARSGKSSTNGQGSRGTLRLYGNQGREILAVWLPAVSPLSL